MKKLFIILIFFSIISNVSASIKENIIKKFTDIENVSFDFEQNINGKIENGTCIIEYPKKIYCEYNLSNQKILVADGKSLVIKTEGKASTSFLQRKLQIGYNRAARIIDMMESEGIVSKANHVGKRDVLK